MGKKGLSEGFTKGPKGKGVKGIPENFAQGSKSKSKRPAKPSRYFGKGKK